MIIIFDINKFRKLIIILLIVKANKNNVDFELDKSNFNFKHK